ncbi:hypothetical protein J4558_24070 [Leptolyngbya sp. 15MV]|nr:hypothetical protein J4558_24070 [Leptolyngbya sp. 15MV]
MMIRALALGLAALLSAAPLAAQETLLRTRLNSDIRSTDPGTNRDANTDAVVQHVVEGLVAYREDMSVGPLLAERVDISEDGRVYTFTLRQGVRFHNGATLTAADVRFAWDRYMRRETNWRCLPEFDGRGAARVTAMETPDPHTVVFRLQEPSALSRARSSTTTTRIRATTTCARSRTGATRARSPRRSAPGAARSCGSSIAMSRIMSTSCPWRAGNRSATWTRPGPRRSCRPAR